MFSKELMEVFEMFFWWALVIAAVIIPIWVVVKLAYKGTEEVFGKDTADKASGVATGLLVLLYMLMGRKKS